MTDCHWRDCFNLSGQVPSLLRKTLDGLCSTCCSDVLEAPAMPSCHWEWFVWRVLSITLRSGGSAYRLDTRKHMLSQSDTLRGAK